MEHASLPAPVVVAALGALGAVISCVLTGWLVKVGHRAGALDSAGAAGHSKALRPIPNIGGIAIVGGVCIPLIAGIVAAMVAPPARVQEAFPSLADSLGRLDDALRPAWVIALGALALHAAGLWDDRRAMKPVPKLLVQLAVAALTVWLADLRVLTFLDAYPGGALVSGAITALWIVTLCNSINFLDNMDGLAGGVGLIGAACLSIGACIARQWLTAGLLALLAGSLLGFLVFNARWTKLRSASIFMGDGGSLPVGYLLAVLSVKIVFVNPSEPGYALGTHWYGVLAPLVVLAVPLYDTATVVLLRHRQGRSPMVGDQQHFSHRLVMRGLTPRGAVAVIWALSGICGVSGLLLGSAAPWQAALIGAQVAMVLGALAGLERPMLARMHEGGGPGARTRDPA